MQTYNILSKPTFWMLYNSLSICEIIFDMIRQPDSMSLALHVALDQSNPRTVLNV